MKKLLAIAAVACMFVACAGGASKPAEAGENKAACCDSTKACCDSAKAAVADSTVADSAAVDSAAVAE